MTDDDWSSELLLFEKGGATLVPGLTAAELPPVEEMHGFRFPPDLRSLLSQRHEVPGTSSAERGPRAQKPESRRPPIRPYPGRRLV